MGRAFLRVDLQGHPCHVQDATQDMDTVRNAMELEWTIEKISHAKNARLVKLWIRAVVVLILIEMIQYF